jgi:hypothetical protein
MAELPRPVQLVAEVPPAHTERIRRTVGGPLLGQGRACTAVRVFEEVERLQNAAGAKVEREHDLNANALTPPRELVQPDLICLKQVPCEIKPLRPPLA